jgi:hypothetical protein
MAEFPDAFAQRAPEAQEYIHHITEGARKLEGATEDLLSLARLGSESLKSAGHRLPRHRHASG